jgi:mRNA-degrading endonuclease RelE of RelBE toxin-antitoxin system
MDWTIRFTPSALQSLYQIPRGTVANVTAAIRGLARVRTPLAAMAAPDRPNTYVIEAEGYLITYELKPEQRIVLILTIE